MITLRRAEERHHDRRRKQEVWLTFYPQDRADPLAEGFGTLEILNEDRLPPGAGVPRRPHHDAEIVTYVREGALAYEDSIGCSGVTHAGEFQRMTIGRGIRHNETNASRTDWAHVFRISLRPSEAGLGCTREQKRFATGQRHNMLCVVASPDGREGSLRILQDALIYSSVLDPGHHLIHELLPGRSAWLHVVYGQATLHDIILTQGDGMGFTIEPSVSLTAQENTEILLIDLGPTPRSFASEVVPRRWGLPRTLAQLSLLSRRVDHLARWHGQIKGIAPMSEEVTATAKRVVIVSGSFAGACCAQSLERETRRLDLAEF
jgi:redox-sensitive bicupin YhaK (pirin superfamily)